MVDLHDMHESVAAEEARSRLDRILTISANYAAAWEGVARAAAEYSANTQLGLAQLLAVSDEPMGEVDRVMAVLAEPVEPQS